MRLQNGFWRKTVQKLLYYAQGIHLALYHTPLFREDILAWPHGPVIPEVYNEYKKFGKNQIDIALTDEDLECVNEIEKDIAAQALELAYDNFAIYTAWQLREMTHQEGTPWEITMRNSGINSTIPNSLIQNYFATEVMENGR